MSTLFSKSPAQSSYDGNNCDFRIISQISFKDTNHDHRGKGVLELQLFKEQETQNIDVQRNQDLFVCLFVFSYLAAGVVGMFGQLAIESLEKNLIGDFAHIHAGLIQNSEDALMLLLHQVNDDLIIEVINLRKDREESRQLQMTTKMSKAFNQDYMA